LSYLATYFLYHCKIQQVSLLQACFATMFYYGLFNNVVALLYFKTIRANKCLETIIINEDHEKLRQISKFFLKFR